MPVFQIPDDLIFPDPSRAEDDGLLGVGGDLSAERLLLAYRSGIFPWHEEEGAPLWWSPDPRCVLFPEKLKVSQSLRKRLRKRDYEVTVDRRFDEVIRHCAEVPRQGQSGTWITDTFVAAYNRLHTLGYAHSVEVMMEGRLAGGLYGVAVGRVFCGESMFSLRTDASKIALVHLAGRLKGWGFPVIDCQIANPYLLSMGAEEIGRDEFLRILRENVGKPGRAGKWDRER
jgi:leucyl/phenylalanyl-tRNA---protein transferase